jgi:hypothetical protein
MTLLSVMCLFMPGWGWIALAAISIALWLAPKA